MARHRFYRFDATFFSVPIILSLLFLIFLILFTTSLLIGANNVSDLTSLADLISLSRLPRSFAAALSGAGLAIGGLVMQALAKNRLVDPSVTGTSQSAALGLLMAALLWPSAPMGVKMLLATAVAMAGTGLFLLMLRRLPPTQPHMPPLVGIVFGGVIGSITTFIAWRSEMLQFLAIAATGEFSGVISGRYELLWLSALLILLAWWVADRLTLLSMGEGISIGLGLDIRATLRIGLIIVAAMSAVSVSVVGMLPFVGLIVPNLVSRAMGDHLRQTIPIVALCGAIMLLACDILGRLLRYPYEIPASTVLGGVGALIMLALLRREALREG